MSAVVKIYTDGACKGNPGVGGWGALLELNGKEKELCGGEPLTTTRRRPRPRAAPSSAARSRRSARAGSS